MGIFTGRERAELDKSPPALRMQERRVLSTQASVRNSIREDYAPRRRPADNDLGDHVGSLMQRATAASLREIDDLIVELRRRREGLVRESARVQNEILEFAKLNHSAIESTKIITERLASFNGSPSAGRVRAPSASPMREVRSDNAPTRDAGKAVPRNSRNQIARGKPLSIRTAETKLPSAYHTVIGPELCTGPV